ncbi:MAG: DUF1800 family protein [Betaproteobacteria bacterium]|nr:DUF1800 family protein [Betaproteobacteria bacterium]
MSLRGRAAPPPPPPPPPGPPCAAGPALAAEVIEFHNANLDNYFITADRVEAAAIDGGAAGPGWSRTGFNFSAGGPTPVCRFYGSITPGPNSHFYTALPDECAALKQLQASTPATEKRWNFESLDFVTTVPAGGACPAGTIPVYRAYNGGFARGIDSNHRITTSQVALQQVVNRGWSNEGVVMCAPSSAPVSNSDIDADIVRLLEQATMGPTEALLAEVKQKGIPAWLDEQLGLYESKFAPQAPWGINQTMEERVACLTDPACGQLVLGTGAIAREFFTQAINGRDQVRQRFAYVLHQLLVLGGNLSEAYAIRNFQQMIRDVAFSTYEDALFQYTISPQLGDFQGWVMNEPEHDGIKPNENYAREIMQLLTTGVNRLHEDGTEQKDGAGKAVPAYTQLDVTSMSRVLTGYASAAPGRSATFSTTRVLRRVDGRLRSPSRPWGEELLRWYRATARRTKRRGRRAGGRQGAGGAARYAAVHCQATDPASGHQQSGARLRAPHRVGVQGQRRWRAWRPEGGAARHPARPRGAGRAQDRSEVWPDARAGAVPDVDCARA